jgi:hypothetical protein
MAAASTGVINANILIVKNNAIDKNGNKTLRLRNPGILNILRVISKFVNPIVELAPAKITDIIAMS